MFRLKAKRIRKRGAIFKQTLYVNVITAKTREYIWRYVISCWFFIIIVTCLLNCFTFLMLRIHLLSPNNQTNLSNTMYVHENQEDVPQHMRAKCSLATSLEENKMKPANRPKQKQKQRRTIAFFGSQNWIKKTETTMTVWPSSQFLYFSFSDM